MYDILLPMTQDLTYGRIKDMVKGAQEISLTLIQLALAEHRYLQPSREDRLEIVDLLVKAGVTMDEESKQKNDEDEIGG